MTTFEKEDENMKLRDNFWLWGHKEGVFNMANGNEGVSRMTPMEGCLYLGVRNVFMVPMYSELNRRQYNKSFKTLKEVAWDFRSGTDPELLRAYIDEAVEFPNIGRVVYDDFVRLGKNGGVTVDNLYKAHDILHNNDKKSLDMWMVLYTNEFGLGQESDADLQQFINPFDGIIMWTWEEKDVPLIPEKYEIFKKMTEGKKRMFGCYLWNFGEKKEATGKTVKWQLDWYREKMLLGEAEGVVLHTNTMADLDYEAYDVAVEWMEKHGDEEI